MSKTIATLAVVLTCMGCCSSRSGARPLKVFILAGQSNMQGHAQITTFERMALDPAAAPILEKMTNPDGTPRVCRDVWISSIGSSAEEKTGQLTAGFGAEDRGPKIGPEFTFGIYARELLGEPILIIKTAWGGKSLNTDFRSPGAGPFVFNESQLENFRKQGKDIEQIKADKAEATGHYYRLMMDHVKTVLADVGRVVPGYDPAQGVELAGFVWFQGWNDMVDRGVYPDRDKPGGYDAYSETLAAFIRDVRKDLSAPGLPFVIGVMGTNGPLDEYPPDEMRYRGIHSNFREAMAAPAEMPEFRGNVVAVRTAPFWDTELVQLRLREAELRDRLKAQDPEGKLSRAEQQAALEKLRKETFSERELTILEKGASNAGYHYLGSAMTMARIGKAFAEAAVGMQQQAE